MGELNGVSQIQDDLVPACNIVTPVGMLGYGFNEDETANVLRGFTGTNVPTALVLDSGSTDSGPSKLALGAMSCPRQSYVRDLTKLTKLVHEFKVPLIFSSAGGDGSDDHVREMLEVLKEIVAKEGNEQYQFKTIAIFSEVSKPLVLERLRDGVISGCGQAVPALTEKDIESTPRIVSQMGPEPFLEAMTANPDFNIIVGGRAYDPSPYVAFAAFASKTQVKDTASLMSQRLWGGFTHMGKIMECGGQCATPKSSGSTATVYSNGTFDISPHDPEARCTPNSVAAHTLYEKTRPDLLYGPGGHLDLSASKYKQLKDGRTCRVQGGLFHFSRDAGQPYRIKLEAATIVGYRSMFMGSIKDPILIDQIDWFLEDRVKWYVRKQHQHAEGEWELDFHRYGQDHVSTLPGRIGQLGEVFLIGEALGSTPELAKSVASTARIATAHGGYPNQKATSGNLAWGIGGRMEIELGPCAEFSIYHLMDLKEGEEGLSSTNPLFRQTVQVMGEGREKKLTNGDLEAMQTNQAAQTQTNKTATTNGVQLRTNGPYKHIPMTLGDIALFLRSKNAGPYEITFDVVFETEQIYRMVKDADILNRSNCAKLLTQKEDDIIWIGYFDQALAFKVTIPRLRRGKVVPNGSYMEGDIWAAQQYLPLMTMTLPESFVSLWMKTQFDKKMSEGTVRRDPCHE